MDDTLSEWPYWTTYHLPLSLLIFASVDPLAIYEFPCLLQLEDYSPTSRLLLNPSPRVLGEVIIIQFLPPSPTTLPISHSAPATQASLQFPKHTKPAPASGHLHQLFLLPKMCFPGGILMSNPFIALIPLLKCPLPEVSTLTTLFTTPTIPNTLVTYTG